MTSSASQESRVMGKPRKTKRARNTAVAAAVAETTRVQHECQNALTGLGRLQQQQQARMEALAIMEREHNQAVREYLGEDEMEMLDAADDVGDVAEDGVDDGGPPPVPVPATHNFVGVRDANRKRCARCHKFLPQSAVPEASFVHGAVSVCNTVSDVSMLGADDQELADDGASSA